MNTSAFSLSPPARDGLGVGLAVGVSGLAFGTTAATAGLSVAQACALSLLCFTGASQFALVGVVAGGGSVMAGATGALLLGARNTLYGLRLADVLGWHGGRRIAAAHGLIDETAAVALAQRGRRDARTGYTVTFASLFLCWNLTTLVGALAADRIGDPAVFGLDAVGPALFLALVWPRLREEGRRSRLVALLGVLIALAATPLVPPGVPVLLAAVAALAGMGGAAGSDGDTPGDREREVRP
ncbi:AzlC family ABC transporter permease [Allosalinactinospora lopnorensis]|uniref:AzlC family ABC transporter permease n=1 Tax=Allosalinactinospora lopnorensis TaxID=1352348 RepID=UPI000623D3F3|nr:AzlC family ABC transporter permease [Allosalinactinospora lopnorensis]